MDLVQISKKDASCHHGQFFLHGFIFAQSRMYYYYCQEAYKLKLTVISTNTEPAFIVTGFFKLEKSHN